MYKSELPQELNDRLTLLLENDSLAMMRHMLEYYNRGLFIETGVGDQVRLKNNAMKVSEELDLQFEKTDGSTKLLKALTIS
ncbi:MAG: DUF1638 domain-containing protein [Spirochaetales bacterium]|uniref:DUF1638 domain-containing protein n=1 Tax=Candidatus Thalassospirochaeta sargassi TaxID=3119039 RepID=A0AAJ1IER3_9SPIO|nr:DUF1638 domain-containing protein [Spirochaetales bacterium]